LIPRKDDLERWQFSRLPRFEGMARTIARSHGGVTVIFAEKLDGSYEVTKMQGGRVLNTKRLVQLPDHITPHIDKRQKRNRRPT
jgi:hypothetical protein